MKPLVDRTMEPVRLALADAKKTKERAQGGRDSADGRRGAAPRGRGQEAPRGDRAPPPSGTREADGKEGVVDAEFEDTGT
jgi:hypothetical protein